MLQVRFLSPEKHERIRRWAEDVYEKTKDERSPAWAAEPLRGAFGVKQDAQRVPDPVVQKVAERLGRGLELGDALKSKNLNALSAITSPSELKTGSTVVDAPPNRPQGLQAARRIEQPSQAKPVADDSSDSVSIDLT